MKINLVVALLFLSLEHAISVRNSGVTKRKFDPNLLMDKYMNMRTNEGAFGSYNPNDVINTVSEFFPKFEVEPSNTEEKENTDDQKPNHVFDPNNWGFSLYNPNDGLNYYLGKVSESSLSGSVSAEPTSENQNAPLGMNFNPNQVNDYLMSLLKSDGSSYQGGTVDESSSPYNDFKMPVFDAGKLNNNLFGSLNYDASKVNSEAIPTSMFSGYPGANQDTGNIHATGIGSLGPSNSASSGYVKYESQIGPAVNQSTVPKGTGGADNALKQINDTLSGLAMNTEGETGISHNMGIYQSSASNTGEIQASGIGGIGDQTLTQHSITNGDTITQTQSSTIHATGIGSLDGKVTTGEASYTGTNGNNNAFKTNGTTNPVTGQMGINATGIGSLGNTAIHQTGGIGSSTSFQGVNTALHQTGGAGSVGNTVVNQVGGAGSLGNTAVQQTGGAGSLGSTTVNQVGGAGGLGNTVLHQVGGAGSLGSTSVNQVGGTGSLGNSAIYQVGGAGSLGSTAVNQVGETGGLGNSAVSQVGGAGSLGSTAVNQVGGTGSLGNSAVSQVGGAGSLGNTAINQVGGAGSLGNGVIHQVGGAGSLGNTAINQVGGTGSLGNSAINQIGGAGSLDSTTINQVGGAGSLGNSAVSQVGGTGSLGSTAVNQVGGAGSLGNSAASQVGGAGSLGSTAVNQVGGSGTLGSSAISQLSGSVNPIPYASGIGSLGGNSVSQMGGTGSLGANSIPQTGSASSGVQATGIGSLGDNSVKQTGISGYTVQATGIGSLGNNAVQQTNTSNFRVGEPKANSFTDFQFTRVPYSYATGRGGPESGVTRSRMGTNVLATLYRQVRNKNV